MKLGRSAIQAHRSSGGTTEEPGSSTMHEEDASEPLLNNYHTSNPVADYYAHTRIASQLPGDTSLGSIASISSRTICSPQHPSQDLIEMLNRNQQITLIRNSLECQTRNQQTQTGFSSRNSEQGDERTESDPELEMHTVPGENILKDPELLISVESNATDSNPTTSYAIDDILSLEESNKPGSEGQSLCHSVDT